MPQSLDVPFPHPGMWGRVGFPLVNARSAVVELLALAACRAAWERIRLDGDANGLPLLHLPLARTSAS